jgi:hypothetical protein
LFISFTSETVSITIQWGDRELSQEFQPTYIVTYPNGPSCRPSCKSATIEFEFPDQ